MLTKLIKRVFIPVLLVALLWPTPAGYYSVRLGLAVCIAGIWALQASRSRYLRQAAHTSASPKVKYEN
jgi:hypothetical protein